ncbi:MAG: type II toxin-antitoxin system RelE/ParE family toxin [Desulfobacteraceae bacterium]|nr:type II toxin-antitoxin system RelE/ParE family toxin [Desulfobacteraceae bacterium]
MAWTVEFQKDAEKELGKLDRQQAKRILRYLYKRIATDEDPRRFGDGLKSNLAGLWKYRIGNYRAICDIQDSVVKVIVVRVRHRREVYRS